MGATPDDRRLAALVRFDQEQSPAELLYRLARVGRHLLSRAQAQGRRGYVVMCHAGGQTYRLEWSDDSAMETNEHPNPGSGYAISKEQIGGVPFDIVRSCKDGTIDSMSVLRQIIEFRLDQLRKMQDTDDAGTALHASIRSQELRFVLDVIAGPVRS